MSYQGVPVSDNFRRVWQSGHHVGSERPSIGVWIRRGEFRRSRGAWPGEQFGDISGKGSGGGVWMANWTPLGDWILLPGVKTCRKEQSYENNGITSLTLDIDNQVYQEVGGAAGIFHLIQRGYLAPLRGYQPPGRPPPGIGQNEWFLRLPNAQILIREGYGGETPKTFTGLIDDLDINSKPSTIQITARDFGGVLVDEHFFGWCMDPNLRDPIVFMPRKKADDTKKVGGGAKASSERPGYPAKNVLDTRSSTAWESQNHTDGGVTEWCEIHIPAGRYRSIYVYPQYPGMEAFLGIYVRPRGDAKLLHGRWTPDGGNKQVIDEDILQVTGYYDGRSSGHIPVGWLNIPGSQMVPGTYGGWTAMKVMPSLAKKGQTIDFGGEVEVGDNTVIRLGFRNLYGQVAAAGESLTEGLKVVYRAGLKRMIAIQRNLKQEAKKSRWILTDDATDIVKTVLRWAGFKQWEIQEAGINLKQEYVVNKANSFMDTINEVKDQLGYTFFIAEPDQSDDLSIGVPVFRMNRVFSAPQAQVEEITSQGLLTDAKVRYSNESERSPIRVRGAELSKKKGGAMLGGDKVRRAMFSYVPPWEGRMAGVIKHLTHYDEKLTTITDCQFACYLIALQIGLSQFTGIIETLGTSHIGLDTLVSVVDPPSGTDGRLYVSNRVSEFVAGEDGHYTSELAGSFPDTPDILGIALTYLAAAAEIDRNDDDE